jgi:sugar phosphate isomerase/epimerase
MQLLMFSKHLQELNFEQLGERVKEMGLDGVDLTTRPGGHVLPENVKSDLPKAVKTLEAQGLNVGMITTSITDANEPFADDIFATAAQCGIGFAKLGYWSYKGLGTLKEAIEDASRKMEGIEALAKKRGVKACIHNHSGNCLSAQATVVYMILNGCDPQHVGAYVDPGHMTVEGGLSGWRMGIDILSDYISLVAVKTFGWFSQKDEQSGETRWRPQLVPLPEGVVQWREVFHCLKQIGFDGCVSVHSEYQGGGSWRDLNLEELIEQTKQDVAYLRTVVG